ncbi:MAG: hypothetical protein NTU83_01020, partial [Candidatus Hydrogenedentes bacterium]|nr:hypothetical protein [Candidatus Hydrogenedentota bacterium]
MKRRDFLRTGVSGGAAGLVAWGAADDSPAIMAEEPAARNAPPIFTSYRAEAHRLRLQNIGFCEKAIGSCM